MQQQHSACEFLAAILLDCRIELETFLRRYFRLNAYDSYFLWYLQTIRRFDLSRTLTAIWDGRIWSLRKIYTLKGFNGLNTPTPLPHSS